MAFESTASVARQTGIPRSTLRYYIKESWKEERESDRNELLQQIVAAQAPMLREITGVSLSKIMAVIDDMNTEKMSVKDALTLAKTLEVLNKVAMVDQVNNYSSEKTETLEQQLIDMTEVRGLDPFALDEGQTAKKDK